MARRNGMRFFTDTGRNPQPYPPHPRSRDVSGPNKSAEVKKPSGRNRGAEISLWLLGKATTEPLIADKTSEMVRWHVKRPVL